MYRSIYTGESTTGMAVKAAVRGLRSAIKQSLPTRGLYDRNANLVYPFSGFNAKRDIFNPPTFAVSPLNQARMETRQRLQNQLGTKPTKEQMHAGMQEARAAARAAGTPLAGMYPDNSPPVGRYYPHTQDDREWSQSLADFLRKAGIPEADIHDQVLDGMDDIRYSNLRTRRWTGVDDIQPNARIRGEYYFDPRKPEKWNRAHTTQPQGNDAQLPHAPYTQDEMDQIRRDYYTRHPNLVPVEGQPGYNVWKNQVLRGK